MTCAYCDQADYCGSTINPRMCIKHFGLVLIGLRLARMGSVVQVGTIRMELRRMSPDQRRAVAVDESEVVDLLRQLEQGGFKFPQGNWKRRVNQMRIGGVRDENICN
jgi:hypothetical protein